MLDAAAALADLVPRCVDCGAQPTPDQVRAAGRAALRLDGERTKQPPSPDSGAPSATAKDEEDEGGTSSSENPPAPYADYWWCRTCCITVCKRCHLMRAHSEHRSNAWRPEELMRSCVQALEGRCVARTQRTHAAKLAVKDFLAKVEVALLNELGRLHEAANEPDRRLIAKINRVLEKAESMAGGVSSPLPSSVGSAQTSELRKTTTSSSNLYHVPSPARPAWSVWNLATNEPNKLNEMIAAVYELLRLPPHEQDELVSEVGSARSNYRSVDALHDLRDRADWSVKHVAEATLQTLGLASTVRLPSRVDSTSDWALHSSIAGSTGVPDAASGHHPHWPPSPQHARRRGHSVDSSGGTGGATGSNIGVLSAAHLHTAKMPVGNGSTASGGRVPLQPTVLVRDRPTSFRERSTSAQIGDRQNNIAAYNPHGYENGGNGGGGGGGGSVENVHHYPGTQILPCSASTGRLDECDETLSEGGTAGNNGGSQLPPPPPTTSALSSYPAMPHDDDDEDEDDDDGEEMDLRISRPNEDEPPTTPGAVEQRSFGDGTFTRPICVLAFELSPRKPVLAVSDSCGGVYITEAGQQPRMLGKIGVKQASASSTAVDTAAGLLYVSIMSAKARCVNIYDIRRNFVKIDSIACPKEPRVELSRTRWLTVGPKGGQLFVVSGDNQRSALWTYVKQRKGWKVLKESRKTRYQYLCVAEDQSDFNTVVLLTCDAANNRLLLFVVNNTDLSVVSEYDVSKTYAMHEQLTSPAAAIVDAAGNLLVLDYSTGKLFILEAASNANSKAVGSKRRRLRQVHLEPALGPHEALGISAHVTVVICMKDYQIKQGDWVYVACFMRREVRAVRYLRNGTEFIAAAPVAPVRSASVPRSLNESQV